MEELKRFINLQLFAGDNDGDSDAGGDKGGKDGGDDKGTKDKDTKDSGDAGGSSDKDTKGQKDSGDAGGTGGTGTKDKGDDKLFTQDELNAIITRRLARAEKDWQGKMEAEKEKAAMTETEKLKVEKEEAEKKATAAVERANQRLIRAEVIAVATGMEIVDADAAYALMDRDGVEVDEKDNVKGVKEALKLLVKEKPYLIQKKETKKTGDDQRDDKGNKGGVSMNDLIRKAAGMG